MDELDQAVHVAGRSFELTCDLEILSLAPLRTGLELAPLVPRLRVFPRPQSWTAIMRRPLLALPSPDAELIGARLRQIAGPPEASRQAYLDAPLVNPR